MSKYAIVPEPPPSTAVQEQTNTIWSSGFGTLSQIETTLNGIETTLNGIEEIHADIRDDIDRLRVLADYPDGEGIATRGPYNDFPMSVLYLLYVKQAEAIATPDVSSEDQAASIEKLRNVINELRASGLGG